MVNTTALCYVVYNNHHVTPIYDSLSEMDGLCCQRVSWGQLPEFRKSLGWDELGDRSGYYLAWRHLSRHAHILRLAVRADVAIIPGPFTAPALNVLLRVLGKRIYAYSEPLLAHPRTNKAKWSLFIRRLFLLFVDSPKFTLLEMGRGAHEDYRFLGMKRFRAVEFCFSVAPNSRFESNSTEKSVPLVPEDQTVRLLFVGSIERRKGLDLLLSALTDDAVCSSDWILTVVGAGPSMGEMQQFCTENELWAKVQFAGVMTRSECDKVYAKSDIIIVPSRFDGWAAVVNEGMEMGLTAIASDMVGSARQLVENGVNGFIFPSEDTAELTRALRALVSSHEQLQLMKDKSAAKVKKFRPSAVAARLASLIETDRQGAPSSIHEGICNQVFPGSG